MRILDATAGYRGMWFDKDHPDTVFIDIRPETRPGIIADNTQLPFKDETFDMAIYDPPHIKGGPTHWCSKKYGTRKPTTFKRDIRLAAGELLRVLRHEGILIFKWSTHDIALSTVLKLFPARPLFGHNSSSREYTGTHWLTFIKTAVRRPLEDYGA